MSEKNKPELKEHFGLKNEKTHESIIMGGGEELFPIYMFFRISEGWLECKSYGILEIQLAF